MRHDDVSFGMKKKKMKKKTFLKHLDLLNPKGCTASDKYNRLI